MSNYESDKRELRRLRAKEKHASQEAAIADAVRNPNAERLHSVRRSCTVEANRHDKYMLNLYGQRYVLDTKKGLIQ